MSLVFKSEFHSVVSAADDICSDMLLTYVGHKVEKSLLTSALVFIYLTTMRIIHA